MNRENWRDLGGLLDELKQRPAVRGVTVQLFYPYGQGEEALALEPGERREAIQNVITLKKRGTRSSIRNGPSRGCSQTDGSAMTGSW